MMPQIKKQHRGLTFFLGCLFSFWIAAFPLSSLAQESKTFVPAKWSDLPGWEQDDFKQVGAALIQSCSSLVKQDTWKNFCAQARKNQRQPQRLKELIVAQLRPYQVVNQNRQSTGLITGYYEPLLRGSFFPSKEFRYPIYARPDDLVEVQDPLMAEGFDVPVSRGKIQDNRLVPYDTRGSLMKNGRLTGYELLWVSDPIELFFLQVQGSGRILIEDEQIIRVGFADHNGYPYRSIGRVLIDRGELLPHEASMQRIRQWAKDNPHKVDELLAQNPRYIFFRIQGGDQAEGPIGSLGFPLTPERSVAVDRRYIQMGAPVFISTTQPNSNVPLNRLMFAQDTGNAIQGPVRADFFWGYGPKAERMAGSMKETLRMWVLLPK